MSAQLTSILSALALTAVASAQPTAFTYQGRLKNGAQPAAGLHDFRFRLFDAASGGSQVGAIQCVDNILIAEGLFTATIDFGQQFDSSVQRFLEIEVRADTGLTCGSATGFVVLGPRQFLTAAPLAAHAKSAFSLDAPDGSPASAVYVDNDGKVGIGTTTPAMPLDIRHEEPVAILHDSGPASTQSGYLGFWNSNNAETAWVGFGTPGSPHFSVVNARTNGDVALFAGSGGALRLLTQGLERLFVNSAGNVGVGTTSPAAKLDVRGDIRLGPTGQFRATSGDENLRIVRGSIASDGSILEGTGFTVIHNLVGRYVIDFSPAFAAPPTVSAIPVMSSIVRTPIMVMSNDTPATAGRVVFYIDNNDSDHESFNFTDREFHFIAVGPR